MQRTTEAQSSRRSAPSITLEAERALRAELGTLRLLLEGARSSGAERAFVERVLRGILGAERAADALASWAAPRELRPVHSTVAELARSIREHLDGEERRRCHLVVEDEQHALEIDGRVVVDCIVRCIATRLAQRPEVDLMLHVHADGEQVTFSIVDSKAPNISDLASGESEGGVADALLIREIRRIGGRASVHVTGEHKCCVVVVPKSPPLAEEAA